MATDHQDHDHDSETRQTQITGVSLGSSHSRPSSPTGVVQTAKSLGKFVCRKLLVSVPASAGLELIGLVRRARRGQKPGLGALGVSKKFTFSASRTKSRTTMPSKINDVRIWHRMCSNPNRIMMYARAQGPRHRARVPKQSRDVRGNSGFRLLG